MQKVNKIFQEHTFSHVSQMKHCTIQDYCVIKTGIDCFHQNRISKCLFLKGQIIPFVIPVFSFYVSLQGHPTVCFGEYLFGRLKSLEKFGFLIPDHSSEN